MPFPCEKKLLVCKHGKTWVFSAWQYAHSRCTRVSVGYDYSRVANTATLKNGKYLILSCSAHVCRPVTKRGSISGEHKQKGFTHKNWENRRKSAVGNPGIILYSLRLLHYIQYGTPQDQPIQCDTAISEWRRNDNRKGASYSLTPPIQGTLLLGMSPYLCPIY